ncbi:hypothetical protein GIW50_08550 [Pseudomonas syringae]|uniref:Uncharacterized protein n=1 Tax=Pseudomonas syringae TaxID=317 RepID=A0A9Q3X3S3_PSESX|nr:hypothetical protein [Pseudomonas sp. ICMP 460]MCF5051545.1 hypothetical protein [Pseudomonas syringae]MCF5062624.1 hypothetical protein [Pseudomonas syringae]MCF5075477.1 hypothetical protein [Pseudomonas syringae]MCF5118451.1 hypothetical protein [Pseudomonas syringae]MCF5376947.1 hypothetical protein [Pseudomonas syringae]
MKKTFNSGVALLLSVATSVMAADAPSNFIGNWRVAGVAVSANGVQALGDNDPSLMGKRLTFTPQRLAWDQPTATNDACAEPTLDRLQAMPPAELQPQLRQLGMRHPVAYMLRCGSGTWGPGDQMTVYLGAAGAVAMPWYDGGVLKLVKLPPPKD